MPIGRDLIQRVIDGAVTDGRRVLYESEGMQILEACGIKVPPHVFMRGPGDVSPADLAALGGDRVVLKVVSPGILHKTDSGGVAVVDNNPAEVTRAIERMTAAIERYLQSEGLTSVSIDGFAAHRYVEYDHSLGGELLLGFRWTDDFGPVVVFGPGGIHTEILSDHFKSGRDLAIFSALVPPTGGVGASLSRAAVTQLLTSKLRGRAPLLPLDELVSVCSVFADLAREFAPRGLTEFEVNPLVVSGTEVWALDALGRLDPERRPPAPPRPLDKFASLMEPETIAIMGVSATKLNPGRIILNNTLRQGFDKSRIYIVKPGTDNVDGCRCVPDIASLPVTVDLIVLAVGAGQIPAALNTIIDAQKAEAVIVIPGGFDEKSGNDETVRSLNETIARSRTTSWRGPLINGGNSLGIRSQPGRYNTIFIPRHKLGHPESKPGDGPGVAFVSQSGAFAIVQGSKLSSVNMRYTISIGNQMDLTLGDYLEFLEQDPLVDIVAVYVEGFKPLDGHRFIEIAGRMAATGRTVIIYSGARSEAGASAAVSHTASVAGNYAITRALALGAGIVVADTLEDFEDLVMLFDSFRGKRVRGLRLGALSNAGFECVALADNLGGFRFDPFTSQTVESVSKIFDKAGIAGIVDVHNPLDVTPMVNDETFERASRAVLEDENVDVGVIGCVPFTTELNTLPAGNGHSEDIRRDDSVARRMVGLYTAIDKPWVAVVDGGPLYFEMRQLLRRSGVPTFKTADRALRLFSVFCTKGIERPGDATF